MEDCKTIQNLLPFYLDDDVLTNAERKSVEQHISHCESCCEELHDMQENASFLNGMGRSIFQAPSGLASQVMEQLHAENPGSLWSDVSAAGRLEKVKTPAGPVSKTNVKVLPLRPRRLISGIAAAALLTITVVGGASTLLPDKSGPHLAQESSSDYIVSSPETNTDKENYFQSEQEIIPQEDGPASPSAPDPVQEPFSSGTDTPDDPPLPTSETAPPASDTVLPSVTHEPAGSSSDAPSEMSEEPPLVPNDSSSNNLVLLNQEDQIRSTLLKMSFEDVESAVSSIEAYAAEYGGQITDKTISSDSNCEIFSIQIPRGQADNFIVSVTSSGFVLSQEQDFKTSLYSQLMEEYLQLQTQLSASASEEVSIQLKTQLAEVEQRMNAAQQDSQYESVVIWVQLVE